MPKMFVVLMTFTIAQVSAAQLTCQLSVEQNSLQNQSTTARIAGPPGKQGARGPPGDVIQCNCSDNTELGHRIEQLENVITSLKDNSLCNGLVYGSTCVRLLYTAGNAVTYARAADLCAFYGGKLLDIDSDDMFYRVYKYVKENWNGYFQHPTRDYVNVWLASRYINRKIVLSNGTRLDPQSVGFWHRTYPQDDANTNMILLVTTKPERTTTNSHGLFNYLASHDNVVPICQFGM